MGDFVDAALDARAGVAGRGDHRGAQRLAAVARRSSGSRCTRRILVAIENSRGRSRRSSSTSAQLATADRRGAAARARRRRLGRAPLRRAEAARVGGDEGRPRVPRTRRAPICVASGFTVEPRLAMGDPATELIKVAEERACRPDRDVHARPPLHQRPPARQHRRPRPAQRRDAGADDQGQVVQRTARQLTAISFLRHAARLIAARLPCSRRTRSRCARRRGGCGRRRPAAAADRAS